MYFVPKATEQRNPKNKYAKFTSGFRNARKGRCEDKRPILVGQLPWKPSQLFGKAERNQVPLAAEIGYWPCSKICKFISSELVEGSELLGQNPPGFATYEGVAVSASRHPDPVCSSTAPELATRTTPCPQTVSKTLHRGAGMVS